ncbi:MAG: hemerythrin domain-containing protein [Comamonadaceae bacterium]|nr:MAG: hemerythrin domain-containing protein [Comamonadaceae bacterium]
MIPAHSTVKTDEPLNQFSQCHAGIVTHLQALAELPVLMTAAARARSVAEESLRVFRHAVFEHHAEEESELFPAVLRSARAGDERERVQGLVDRLTREHRALEALWHRIEPAVSAGARGKPADVDSTVLDELVRSYAAHALFEEEHFLPLAETILGRNGNHMAALGLSLHMRHMPQPAGYI